MKIFFFFFLFSSLAFSREPLAGSRYEALTGIQKSKDEKKESRSQIEKKLDFPEKNPSSFLAENVDYLPSGARVLDVAMKDGRNAVFLARKGFKVTAIEENEDTFKKAKILAKEFGVRIDALLDNFSTHSFPSHSFDVIICFQRVDKKLIEKMKGLLRSGGHLIVSTQMRGDQALKSGELLDIFKDMRILKYEEPLHRKEYTASIILKKD